MTKKGSKKATFTQDEADFDDEELDSGTDDDTPLTEGALSNADDVP